MHAWRWRTCADFHVASEAIRSSQNAIARAVQQSGPGDVLFFHYSGHGTQVSDRTYLDTETRRVKMFGSCAPQTGLCNIVKQTWELTMHRVHPTGADHRR